MNYDFASARTLYRRAMHPRILVSGDDFEPLRRRIRSGPGKRIAQQMLTSIRPVAQQIVEAEDLAALMDFYGGGAWKSFAYRASQSLTSMALMGQLLQEDVLIEAVRRVLFCKTPTGARGQMTGVGFGGTGAIAFDLIDEHLSPGQHSQFVELLKGEMTAALDKARSGAYLRNAGANIPIALSLTPAWMTLLAIWNEPGVGDLTPQRDELLTMLEASLHASVHPSGYPEEDIGYGSSVASSLILLAHLVQRAGWYDALKQCPRISQFGQAMLHFIMPWGEHLAMTGDHSPTFPNRDFCLPMLASANDDPTLLWLADQLEAGPLRSGTQPPEVGVVQVGNMRAAGSLWSLLLMDRLGKPANPAREKVPTWFCDPGRGLVSFRSGWTSDDAMATFDGSQRSPSAQGHAHASCGHFTFNAVGEYFAINTGRYCIEQDQHNLVLIDGKSGRSTEGQWVQTRWPGRLIACEPGDWCDYAAVDSSHQHNSYWAQRHLLFVKAPAIGGYLVTIEDVNKADDWAEFWWTMQTSPENRITLGRQSATIRGWRRGNLLDVHFALPRGFAKPHALTMAQDEMTTSSYKYIPNPHQRAASDYQRPAEMVYGNAYVRPRLIGKVAGYNGRFMTLMLPRFKGQKKPRVQQLASLDNSLAVRIEWEDRQDTLIWAYEHHLLEAGDVSGRGQWCMVRQQPKTGKVTAWQLGSGTALAVKVNGKTRELK